MAQTLSVTTIQADLQWEDKATNLHFFEDCFKQLPSGAELVVLPEMFSTGFSMQPEKLAETMDGATIQWMRAAAKMHRMVLTGSLIIEDQGSYYNRLIWMLPNGEMGYYDKRHLFGFAGEDQHYQPGDKRVIASLKGWRIHLQVCYDLRFPVWARQQPSEAAAPEYDVLLYVANWPERRSAAWNALLRARAIENQCYVVGVNRVGSDGNQIHHCGDSQVINPLGEILYHSTNEISVHTQLLDKEVLHDARSRFPFWKDADSFRLL